MHAPQAFYCHEQKAYEHQVLFPMSEGSITLVEFSPSDKPSQPMIHLESSENTSTLLQSLFLFLLGIPAVRPSQILAYYSSLFL